MQLPTKQNIAISITAFVIAYPIVFIAMGIVNGEMEAGFKVYGSAMVALLTGVYVYIVIRTNRDKQEPIMFQTVIKIDCDHGHCHEHDNERE